MADTPCWDLAAIEQRVCDIAAEKLCMPRSDVHPGSRLIDDLGFDSLDLFELMMSVEETFSVSFPETPPNAVYKSVFTRKNSRLRDLAEIVYLQEGTGARTKAAFLSSSTRPAVCHNVPFAQLSGTWKPDAYSLTQRLFEPLDSPGEEKVYRRRSDGMRCVLIPPAEVEIGSGDPQALPDEMPLHLARMDAFLIDAEPVSTTAYCRFLNSVRAVEQDLVDWFVLAPNDDRQLQMPVVRSESGWYPVKGVEKLPMVLVSWFGANAYALWANAKPWQEYHTNDRYLPTEAQWEYAARGPRSQNYPWGGTTGAMDLMVCAQHQPGETYQADALRMAAVNEWLGMSPFGLHHMAGNVWQWCRDWYDESFYSRAEASQTNPYNSRETGIRSERGGSWVGPADLCRSSYRRGRGPHAKGRCLGFRCVSDPVAIPNVDGSNSNPE